MKRTATSLVMFFPRWEGSQIAVLVDLPIRGSFAICARPIAHKDALHGVVYHLVDLLDLMLRICSNQPADREPKQCYKNQDAKISSAAPSANSLTFILCLRLIFRTKSWNSAL